jgi:hypothetical protein
MNVDVLKLTHDHATYDRSTSTRTTNGEDPTELERPHHVSVETEYYWYY